MLHATWYPHLLQTLCDVVWTGVHNWSIGSCWLLEWMIGGHAPGSWHKQPDWLLILMQCHIRTYVCVHTCINTHNLWCIQCIHTCTSALPSTSMHTYMCMYVCVTTLAPCSACTQCHASCHRCPCNVQVGDVCTQLCVWDTYLRCVPVANWLIDELID